MALTIDIFDQQGSKLKTQDLDSAVFSQQYINDELMYQAIQRLESSRRQAIASTKTRGEVQGSNKKIYKQKGNGTGRAGEKRSPLRKKGGIVFGPRSTRNFLTAFPKKMRKASLRSALSYQATKSSLVALEAFTLKTPSTKIAVQTLEALKADRKVLIVTDSSSTHSLSYRNIACASITDVAYLDVIDVLGAHKIIFIGSALEKLSQYAG